MEKFLWIKVEQIYIILNIYYFAYIFLRDWKQFDAFVSPPPNLYTKDYFLIFMSPPFLVSWGVSISVLTNECTVLQICSPLPSAITYPPLGPYYFACLHLIIFLICQLYIHQTTWKKFNSTQTFSPSVPHLLEWFFIYSKRKKIRINCGILSC